MCGRAGRKGLDTAGESILMVSRNEKKRLVEMLQKPLKPLKSCLSESDAAMRKMLLEAIATNCVLTCADINDFMSKTLFYSQNDYKVVHAATKESVKFLADKNFIRWKRNKNIYRATQLGQAVYSSSMGIEDAIAVHLEFDGFSSDVILDESLFMLFHLSPPKITFSPDWDRYYDIFLQLSDREKEIGNKLKICPNYLLQRQSQSGPNSAKENVHRKFWCALVLKEIVTEIPFNKISEKFRITRGQIQSLQQSSVSFCYCVSVFCEKLNWWEFQIIAADYADRLKACGEANELMEIPGIKISQAKALFDSGYRDIKSVACADCNIVQRVIQNALPFYDDGKSPEMSLKTGLKLVTAARHHLSAKLKSLKGDSSANSFATPTKRPLLRQNNGENKTIKAASLSPTVNRKAAAAACSDASPMSYSAQLKDAGESEAVWGGFLRLWDSRDRFSFCVFGEENPQKDANGVLNAKGLKGVAVCLSSKESFVIDFEKHFLSDRKAIVNAIEKYFTCEQKTKIAYGIKTQISLLRELCGIRVDLSKLFDPQVANWLYSPIKFKNGESACIERLHALYIHSRSETGIKLAKKLFGGVSQFSYAAQIGGRDVWMCWQLARYLDILLKRQNLSEYFFSTEMKTTAVLTKLESEGIGFNYKLCLSHLKLVNSRIRTIKIIFTQKAGGKVNFDDEKAVSNAIFKCENGSPPEIPAFAELSANGGAVILNNAVLEAVSGKNELAALFLECKKLFFVLKFNLQPFLRESRWSPETKIYKIYPKYDQTASKNGRMVSSNPNIQTTVKSPPFSLFNVRDLIVSSPGNVLVSGDFCQIEARLLAHFSNDPTLLSLFLANTDPISHLAATLAPFDSISNPPPADAAAAEAAKRAVAKKVFYSVLYGGGPASLARQLNLRPSRAAELCRLFSEKYPKAAEFVRRAAELAAERGCVETAGGRKRFFAAGDERKAVNALCQSGCAELLKLAVERIAAACAERGLAARLGILVHDEAVYDVGRGSVAEFVKIMKYEMEHALKDKLRVPLKVKITVGEKWGSMTETSLN